MIQEFTYEQIRTKALKQGVPDNKFQCGHLTVATSRPRRNTINEFTLYTYHLKHYPIDFNDNFSNCKTIKLSRLVD